MKEMQYQANNKIELLDSGTFKNYNYYILSLGTHPTAYVEITKGNKIYEKDYKEINLEVHGGLTYSRDFLWISKERKLQGWFIGWDYAHHGDFSGIISFAKGKQWTVAEIIKDVHCVIEQLKGEMKHGGNSNR